MILFDHVTKKYLNDSKSALDDVSLHIEPNEFVFIVGKSGAGKSTLIKMITKEELQTSGKIIIGGIDLDYVKRRSIPHYRRRLGVVFQDFKLLPTRTVFENVAFALEIAGMSNREINRTVPKVLDLVGLSGQDKKFPHQLSGGEQQRVSIARSVARQPKILIADEPTGNLDKLTRQEIIDLASIALRTPAQAPRPLSLSAQSVLDAQIQLLRAQIQLLIHQEGELSNG